MELNMMGANRGNREDKSARRFSRAAAIFDPRLRQDQHQDKIQPGRARIDPGRADRDDRNSWDSGVGGLSDRALSDSAAKGTGASRRSLDHAACHR